jgi:hypothetical protein
MAGFLFRLETEDGAPAEPSTLTAALPNWPVGSQIYLGKRTLRVIGKRDDGADQPPVLVVEEVAG